MSGRFSGLNQYALDGILRGDQGELARREAQEEIFERGRSSGKETLKLEFPADPNLLDNFADEDIADHLRKQGYVVFVGRSK